MTPARATYQRTSLAVQPTDKIKQRWKKATGAPSQLLFRQSRLQLFAGARLKVSELFAGARLKVSSPTFYNVVRPCVK